MAEWSIEGKTFLITGGASGLGALFVEAFLEGGAKSVAFFDIAQEAGVALAERLNKIYPDKVTFIKCDVSIEESLVECFEAVVNKFKKIDVLINNAGIMNDSPGAWRKACEVNWLGVVSLTMKGLKHMRKDEGGNGGTIMNIASACGITRINTLPVYAGSKAAIIHFGQSLALEPLPQLSSVRIITVCPGATETPLLQNLEERSYDEKAGYILANSEDEHGSTHQSPESVAKAVVHVFKNGKNASVWQCVDDRPAEDITPVIVNNYDALERTIYPS